MITDALISAALGALSALIGLFPATGPVTLGQSTSTTVIGWTAAANSFIPLQALITVIGVLLALQLALYLWDFAVWIYHQIWGSD
ncbi:MAG: hypothetical protein BGO38_05350 [Cellulomonas sp. 73-145]|uniref:hypothetical protein n=1 Tax=Cellulomonas sp. 73-145 TaxID=1895739 RepID=UPI00092C99BC|nr:hypothetical protein [Cellulomonas sp. 73-145]MBN9326848.1 hypothetical protein [Cellulomonas sp.]OJV57561.1 MAG: hypothetical protein BGO38_05350 [Cellulomonas sp. 73-145]